MKIKNLICVLAIIALLVCAGTANADTLFSYDFEGLTAGQTIVGQDNWVSLNNANRKDAWVGVGTGVNTSKVFMSIDDNGTTAAKMSDARCPFDTALTFTTADQEVEFGASYYVERDEYYWDFGNVGASMWYSGIANDNYGTVGIYYVVNDPKTYFRNYSGTAWNGDTLVSGHWYDIKVVMDFSQGKASLYYRDLTNSETAFTADSVITDKDLSLTMTGGQVTFDSIHAFAQVYNNYTQHQFIDNISISKIPEPSTLALLAAGLIGLMAYAWRKRK